MAFYPTQVQVRNSLCYHAFRRPTGPLLDGSSHNNSSTREGLSHIAVFASSPLTASSPVPAASPKPTAQQKPRNYLIYWKNGKPPKSKLKTKSKAKTRSSFSQQIGHKILTSTTNDLVVPFIKPTSRPSAYTRISSPWVSNSCQRASQLGNLRLCERAIFCPNSGPDIGVSIRRCLGNKLIEEVAGASKSIASLLPSAWRMLVARNPKGYLVINWSTPNLPQFNSQQVEYRFSFVRSDGNLMSVGEFVGQIANIYDFWYRCDFDRFYKNKFSIRADTMRLRELILIDEKESLWKVEAGY